MHAHASTNSLKKPLNALMCKGPWTPDSTEPFPKRAAKSAPKIDQLQALGVQVDAQNDSGCDTGCDGCDVDHGAPANDQPLLCAHHMTVPGEATAVPEQATAVPGDAMAVPEQATAVLPKSPREQGCDSWDSPSLQAEATR